MTNNVLASIDKVHSIRCYEALLVQNYLNTSGTPVKTSAQIAKEGKSCQVIITGFRV